MASSPIDNKRSVANATDNANKESKTPTKSQKGAEEGKKYEKLLLVLLAKRGYELSEDKNFEIRKFAVGKEVGIKNDEEDKFDDIVFRYADQENTNNLIFVQLKHKQDKNFAINSKTLYMERHFNLQMYFISFLSTRDELETATSEELRNGKNKYVVIFTNVDLDTEELNNNGFDLQEGPDDIAKFFTFKKTSKQEEKKHCYQFRSVSDKLRDRFKKSSYLHRIARKLANYVIRKENTKNKILHFDKAPLKKYHIFLESEVIEKIYCIENVSSEEQNMKKKQHCCVKFRDDFVDNDQTDPRQELRDKILEAMKEIDSDKSDDELKIILKNTKLKIFPEFDTNKNRKEALPIWTSIQEEDIKDFLNRLVIFVKQPDVLDLTTQICSVNDIVIEGSRVGQSILKTNSKFRDRILKELGIIQKDTLKGKWISGEKIVQFVKEIEEAINAIVITSMHEESYMKYGSFQLSTEFIGSLKGFLDGEDKVLCFSTESTFFSTVKIFQYLKTNEKYREENGHIFIKLENPENKVVSDCAEKAFRSEIHNVLTIECEHAFRKKDAEDFYSRFSDIINSDSNNKKIILIINQNECKSFHEKLKSGIKDKFVQKYDNINLKDFEPEGNPLEKKILTFLDQNEKLSLVTLTGIQRWDDFIDRLSANGSPVKEILDVMFELITKNEITIGSKPLGTSSLEGAYAKLYEEINAETLAKNLLQEDNNGVDNFASWNEATRETYIISGICASDEEKKVNELVEYLGLENNTHTVDNIKSQVGEIGSEGRIQIPDNHFEEEKLRKICHTYPGRRMFWISIKKAENKSKFILQQMYNPEFYLKRIFKKVLIRKDIKYVLADKNLSEIFIFQCRNGRQGIIDCLISQNENEQFQNDHGNYEFKSYSLASEAEIAFQGYSGQNQTVHWFKVEEDKIIWCNSHGSVDSLRRYVDNVQSALCLVKEDNLVKEILDKEVVIIADDPGMGKTTTLTKLYESKHEYPAYWVINVNLREHLQAIRDIAVKNHTVDVFNVVNFLARVDSKLNDIVAKSLLEIAILDKSKNFSRCLLLAVDGFDEVLDEEDRRKIILLLRFLKNETAVKVWITTRLHYKETLENELLTFAIEFVPMNDVEKIVYINKYFRDRLYLILSEQKFSELFLNNDEMQQSKTIVKYTEEFLKKMTSVFNDDIFRFIGTPLQLYLMLDGSINYFIKWTENKDLIPDFDYLGNDIWEVYEKFIDRKYDIYFKKVDFNEPMRKRLEKFNSEQYNKDLAKSKILNVKSKYSLEEFKPIFLSIGIIISQGNNIEFIHSTFKEFFAAKVFIHWIKKEPNDLSNLSKQECLLREILLKLDYKIIRVFLNAELGKITTENYTKLLQGSFKEYGKMLEKLLQDEQRPLWYNGKMLLHVAVLENNTYIVRLLIDCLKDRGNILKNFLFTVDEYVQAGGLAITGNTLHSDEISFNGFSLTDDVGDNALHLACKSANVEIVRILLDAAASISYSNKRNSKEMLQRFLYSRNREGINALDVVVEYRNDVEILKELLMRADDKLKLIVGEHKNCSSFWKACRCGKEEFVKTFLEEFQHDEPSLKQLLSYDLKIGNPLRATLYSSTIFESLLKVAKSINDNNETLKSLLLTDEWCTEPLLRGNVDVITLLVNAAKDLNDDNHTLKQLLLPVKSHPPLYFAIRFGNIDEVEKLLNVAKEFNDDNHTLKQLLLNDLTPDSALFHAARAGNFNVIKLLLKTAVSIDDVFLEKLVSVVNKNGENAIDLMIRCGHEERFDDFLKNFEEPEYRSIQEKVKELYENVSLEAKLYPVKQGLFYSIYFNNKRDFKDILEYAKNSENSNEKLRNLFFKNDDYIIIDDPLIPVLPFRTLEVNSHVNTLHFACKEGKAYFIKELLSHAVNMNDGGATLKELVTERNSENETAFEVLKHGYTSEIKQIMEDLIREAENNNLQVVNILHKLNSALQLKIPSVCLSM